MVATPLYADKVGSHAGLAGSKKTAAFVVEFDTGALTPATTSVIGHLPAHVLVVGGHLATSDLDTGGEALELDFGWGDNAGEPANRDSYTDPYGIVHQNAGADPDPDGFVDSGVLTGDGVGEVYQAARNYRAVVLPRPLYFSRETLVTMTVVAAADAQAAGSATLYLDYIVP